MTSTKALAKLKSLGVPIFRTADAAARLGVTGANATMILCRLENDGLLTKFTRGLWALSAKHDAFQVVEAITAPYLSYISLQSALYFHGMVSQIPTVTYVASLGRSRRITTISGIISVHHLNTSFFFDFRSIGTNQVKIASPEKALMDLIYLSQHKPSLFKALPELERPRRFSFNRCHRILSTVQSASKRTLMERRLELIEKRFKR